MGDRDIDKAKDEFFSEAQEIVDGLSRDLLALDEVIKTGGSDAELVNDVFRAVHTLKGLSGLFGAAMMSGLSHELEDLLDDLRLGRIELTPVVLDLLFRAVELYGKILSAAKGDGPEPADEVKTLLVSLGQVAQNKAGGGGSVVAQYELDPGLLGVLTEYEEHRLRTNLQAGLSLFKLRVAFQLATIDSALDELKAKTRPHGEIITYLPTGEGTDPDAVELEILVATRTPLATLRAQITGFNITIDEVRRRDAGPQEAYQPAGPSIIPTKGGQEVSDFFPPPATFDALPQQARTSVPPPPTAFQSGAPPPIRERDQTARMENAREPGPRELSLKSVSQTVRVDIRKLDSLMNIVGELAIVRSMLARMGERVRARPELRDFASDMERVHRAFDRHLMQMQNGILEVRMVPLGQVFDKLARIVRQLSREADKQVNFVITGAETEIDKLIVEELSDPLMHMIRNAIDHGIEDRDGRMRVGKPIVGTIALNAFQKGNHVVIEVEDDGAGMDPRRIVEIAVRRGMVVADEAQSLTAKEILALVFTPGFSTRDEATSLSGRGVGMDIVKTNIAKLGGVVDITSELGIGTKVTIVLPITLAIISVLFVEVRDQIFSVPLASVEEAIVFDESAVRLVEGREVMTQRGATLPIARLARMFRMEERPRKNHRSYVVIGTVGERRVGFVVDKLIGQQDIVVKALGKSLTDVRGFAGATELGDQRVGLVLDVASLIDEVLASEQQRLAERGLQ